ncbi:hypothetical protein HFA01_20970 [Halobacillus faecis]|uniref:Uncharacterized protein n=1 Tax=Halobacillus faecis TaxID=360184 RepID=A0A511WRS2_9BACI|nr:hypothetical protein HFA01_20970 [Halobacillus faecis]
MEDILTQIRDGNIQVDIGTTSQTSNGGINNVFINDIVSGYYIADDGEIAGPICQVVGVRGDGLLTGVTLPPIPDPTPERGGECECCEQPTRELLQMLFDQNSSADYFTDGFFDNIQDADILDISEGLVKITTGNETYILSTCHISKLQDITPGLTFEP